MNLRTKGAVDPVTLALIAALAVGTATLAGWKPLEIFRKKPPTAQVTQLQADLARAQAALEAAEQARAAAAAAERAKQEEQVRRAQQFVAGAGEALDRVPAAHRTPEVVVAADLTGRAELALGLAIGGLPAAQQQEILRIVDQLLSGRQADLEAARAALAQIEGDVRTLAREREQLQREVQVRTGEVRELQATVGSVQAELTAKTNEVVTYAARADAKAREAGSLGATVRRLLRVGAILLGVWLFLGWGAAPMLKLLRPGRFKNFLRDVIGYLTSGFLHHDAKRKIATQKQA
jgi:Skp family chaperone for outer membrane proteins